MKTGLYIHLPFCRQRCRYCDFTTFADQYDKVEAYVKALLQEMDGYRGEAIDTIYLGGGTPSTLTEAHIGAILEGVRERFDVDKDSEITMEMNPSSMSPDYLAAIRELGVNRVSIGVQSLHDSELTALGRLHDRAQALKSIQWAQEAGFSNISVDVMFGLPDQTFDSFLETCYEVANLGIQHISCYALTLESGTPMYKDNMNGKLNMPGEEAERAMFESAVELFTQHGFQMYEISNFAKQGYRSRHNVKYWKRVSYIGIGVAAHSLYHETRYGNPETMEEYFKMVKEGRNPFDIVELDERDMQNEFLFLGLRMNEGIDVAEFKEKFGKDIFDEFGKTIQWYTNLKMMTSSAGRIRLTLKGMNVSNSIFTSLYN